LRVHIFRDSVADIFWGCLQPNGAPQSLYAFTVLSAKNGTATQRDNRRLGERTQLRNMLAFEIAKSSFTRSSKYLSDRVAALNLDIDYFEDKINEHISMFRAVNYPDQPTPPLPGQLRAGAHTDYGSLTLLRQEQRPGGLQVMTKSGEWFDVPAIKGALVVNIGDLMSEWTNDLWVSTLHRVVNPPRDAANDSRRISLVFFHQPNYDAMISCLPTCLQPGETAKHAPMSSGEHLFSKFVKQATFGQGINK
jgi:isopenicillin N synthase-like dioxygenase